MRGFDPTSEARYSSYERVGFSGSGATYSSASYFCEYSSSPSVAATSTVASAISPSTEPQFAFPAPPLRGPALVGRFEVWLTPLLGPDLVRRPLFPWSRPSRFSDAEERSETYDAPPPPPPRFFATAAFFFAGFFFAAGFFVSFTGLDAGAFFAGARSSPEELSWSAANFCVALCAPLWRRRERAREEWEGREEQQEA